MLGIATPLDEMIKEIATALRDAMDDEDFCDIRFYRYGADVNDSDEYETVLCVERPKSLDEIPTVAEQTAKELKYRNYVDYSIQGYESIVGVFSAKSANGLFAYDITESIVGGDGLEWELEYLNNDINNA